MILRGVYEQGNMIKGVPYYWGRLCAIHAKEFSQIKQCFPGTFNVRLSIPYLPPRNNFCKDRARYIGRRLSEYISPFVRVVEINHKPIRAWLYQHDSKEPDVIELVSFDPIVEVLFVRCGDVVEITIEESCGGFPGDYVVPLGERDA